MTDRNEVANHEKLIEEAELALVEAVKGSARIEDWAAAVWSVFEKALGEATVTPTDDEREAGWSHPEAIYSPEVFMTIQGLLSEAKSSPMHALRLAVSRQMEAAPPQGEPSDAVVLAAMNAYDERFATDNIEDYSPEHVEDMRRAVDAALRAANEVR